MKKKNKILDKDFFEILSRIKNHKKRKNL